MNVKSFLLYPVPWDFNTQFIGKLLKFPHRFPMEWNSACEAFLRQFPLNFTGEGDACKSTAWGGLTCHPNLPINFSLKFRDRGKTGNVDREIATDPPFNTKRNREGTASRYEDKWIWLKDLKKRPDQWKWNEIHPKWLEEIQDNHKALHAAIKAAEECQGKDTAAFLSKLLIAFFLTFFPFLVDCVSVLGWGGIRRMHFVYDFPFPFG